jgi:hypothetical protein
MIKLPPKERKVIAQTARDVARFADERAPHLSGRRRFAVARAEGMRRLKGAGMPQELARTMAPHIQPEPAEQDADERHLSPDERALLDAGKGAAGATVGVIADGIESATGCECPQQLLALVRALLESGIEAAVQAVR